MEQFYRLKEIIGDRKVGIKGIIPVSRAAWYAGIQQGIYPRPVKLSARSSAWLASDIEALIQKLTGGTEYSKTLGGGLK